MYTIIDLGGSPASEACAQLGQTEQFELFNRLEVECYRAALQARFGPPPEGCQYATRSNRHDFGTYYSLALKVWDHAADRDDVATYVSMAEDGLGSWTEAGFPTPVEYDGSAPVLGTVRQVDDCIISALKITRPGSDGRFPIEDFAVLHGNLSALYPEFAARALLQLGGAPS